ncbi:ATP-binding cassette domain-containing protein [Kitasatospora fiedleri]|uniref:ATP-binding cassette domain-containing protein n=1 Tax=Kitasatospora fiedleri TaxID=2991545 RepID=UPI00249A47D8|nr:ATP-binding cassette domain-containing protein [Kitasatospora fiedleri]
MDLQVNAGVLGLLGPNGAGKTTLLRTLATIAPPAEGTLEICGQQISMWEAAESISISIITATLPAGCQPTAPAAAQKYFTAAFELATWLDVRMTGGGQPANVHGGPPGVDRAAVAAVATQPESVQTAWVRDRLSTVRSTDCG